MSAPASSGSQQDIIAARSSIDPEWSFLRIAMSEFPQKHDQLRALCAKVRWKVLFELAARHGVQPLLYQALSGTDQLVPPADLRVLGQLHRTNLHKSMLLARELIHLLEHLAHKKLEVLVYKGLPLAEWAYGDIGLRPVGDIDLLIHGRDLPQLREAVQQLGYLPRTQFSAALERAELRCGYGCVFDGPAGRNLLDVKSAIQPYFYAVEFEHESFFRRAVSIRVAGHEMKTPSAEDTFLILAAHAAKHVWGRLIWICDLARIAQRTGLDWTWIAAQAEDLGIVRIVRVTLHLVKALLGMEPPGAAQNALPQDSASEPLAREIEQYVASATEYDAESVAYFRLMLRLRERWSERMRFISRLAFTPGPGEWAAIRLPESLLPFYRLVRLGRLAKRVVSR